MNKYIKAIAFLVFLPAIMLGQNKVSYGLNLGGQVSPLHIESPSTSAFQDGVYENTEGQAKFEIGAYLQYEIGSRAFVRSGVQYQRATYWYSLGGLVFPDQLTPTGQISESNNSHFNSFDFSSISIPLDLGYRIATKKANINFLVGGGIAFHTAFNQNSDIEIREAGVGSRTIEGASNSYDLTPISLHAFTGVELGFGKSFVLAVEPHLKYSPNKITLGLFGAEVATRFEPGLSIRLRRR